MNKRKNMSYYTLWIEKEEETILLKMFEKPIKSDEDLKTIGDIFNRINSMGNLKC